MQTDPASAWKADTTRYGAIGESSEWKLIIENYYWDRLDAAYQESQALGAGMGGIGVLVYRMIHAEYLTRSKSDQAPLTEWLDMEWIPREMTPDQGFGNAVLTACDSVAQRLGWEHGAKVMLSVLAQEADAPWTDGRFGYMVDKYPFEKICIPLAACRTRERLMEVVAHEYAHVISLNLSQGRVPRWLDEAIAMAMQGETEFGEVSDWLAPDELNAAYHADQSDQRRWNAYQQSGHIGAYLVNVGGEQRLGDLLRDFSNNSTWTELKMAVTGQPPEDEALREAYGFGVLELFDLARTGA